MSLFSKLRGTIETLFSIGLGGPNLKKSSGSALDVRDSGDAAFANVRVAAPVGANDAATKTYADAVLTTAEAYTDAAVGVISVAGVVREIRIPIALVNISSTTSLPAGAFVIDCEVKIAVQYSAGATISVGQMGSVALFQATTDNLPQSTDMFQSMQDTPAASVNPVLVTIGGAPAAGSGFVIVRYAVPNA